MRAQRRRFSHHRAGDRGRPRHAHGEAFRPDKIACFTDLERGDYIKVFLAQRQFLPNPSRKRVAVVSRGIEDTFERVVREGIRSGDFRSDIDPRLTMLTILNAANGVSSWYQKEGFSLEKIAAQMVTLILKGIVAQPNGRKPTRSPR